MYPDALPILDKAGSALDRHDRRQAVLPRDHRAMAREIVRLLKDEELRRHALNAV